jgi:hypothetical protein
MNDVVWSAAVQQGPGAGIIVNAIHNISLAHEKTKAYDQRLIDAIYNERGRKIVGGALNGQLYYFSKNSIVVQQGVADRFVSEKGKAQERLKNESDYQISSCFVCGFFPSLRWGKTGCHFMALIQEVRL